MFQSQTRILVTHGLTYLPHVDRVVVISDGQISESGTYQQLISHNGPFAEFVQNFLREAREEGITESGGKGPCTIRWGPYYRSLGEKVYH